MIQKHAFSNFISKWMRNVQKIHKSWKLAAKKLSRKDIKENKESFLVETFPKEKKKKKSFC
jgi:hypothetical protein